MTATTLTADASPFRLWATIVAAFAVSLLILVAGAFFWVFVYSATIHTSGDAAYYEAYAQVASPVGAVVLSFPVFFYVGRYLRRFGDRATFAALAVVTINLVMDGIVVGTLSGDNAHLIAMSLLAAVGKLLGAWQGSRA